MSEENKKQVDNRTAAQRLADLETAVAQLYRTADYMTRDLSLLKNAAKLLNNKVSAIVEASASEEGVTDAVIDRIMIDNNVKDLANRVTNMIVNGIVSKEDEVSDNAFLVGSETDENGKLTNPRIQFSLSQVSPEVKAKLLGKKAGDVVNFVEGKGSFTLLESYKIQPPPTPEAEAAPEQEAVPAAEAPQLESTPVAE